MWECGVATDPQSPDTRLIVFQCSHSCPPVFADQVRVNVHSRTDIEKFVSQFLTQPDFFPGSTEAIAPGFEASGPEVRDAAEELYKDLQSVVPPLQVQADEDWPVFPFIQLHLPEQVSSVLVTRDDAEANRRAASQSAVIARYDKYASGLFGMAGFQQGFTLAQLEIVFRRKYPDENTGWVGSLCDQMIDGCRWEFPRSRWEYFRISGEPVAYAPMVTRVRRSTAKRSFLFDVYLYRFDHQQPLSTPFQAP